MLRPLESVLEIEALYSHSGMRCTIRDPRWLRCEDNKKKTKEDTIAASLFQKII